MGPSDPWVDAWLNNKPMPAYTFPAALMDFMLTQAEAWMTNSDGPRKQLEEFVPRERSPIIMDGLLYSGFCRDRTQAQRIAPVPVMFQLLYTTPMSADQAALEAATIKVFAKVLSEWCQLHLSGQKYDIAP